MAGERPAAHKRAEAREPVVAYERVVARPDS